MELNLSDSMVFWHWFIAAGIFLIIEMLMPAFFFLWLAMAAVVTGLLVLVFPDMAGEVQLILFAVLSVLSIIAWWRMRILRPKHPPETLLNRRGHHYIGRVFTLEEAIVNGVGKIRVDDSTWKIQGQDLSAGQRVKVVGVDGVVLIVEASSE